MKDLILYYKGHHKSTPLSPLFEEDQPLLKFYEMPDIRSVKVTRSLDGDRLEGKRVQALRDMFYKENKLFNNIYLTADAGYGKTAFSKKLALAWCHAKKPDKREIKHFSKDEVTAMDGFSFVFVVLLRESSSKCNIDELIFYHILSQLPHDYSLENLRKILCEETCLVILDGLDEWTHPSNSCSQGESNIPHKRVRENVAVLTTTTPWKLSVIGLHSNQIDQKLELEGLSDDSAKKLKRSVISHLHGEQDENKIDEYEKQFNMTLQDSHMSDLTAIPLFLMYLLYLWCYRFNVGKSLADLYSSFIELLLYRIVKKGGIQIPKTETDEGTIPPCFDNNTLCKKFYTLLTTLGKLAFYTLFSETKENTLVFDSCTAEKYLWKDELRFCLETGIITQSKIQGASLLQQKTKVSFAHKIMQEFLAALYINSAPDQINVQEIVLSKCKCVKDILDMSKIFMFIVSISGNFSFSRELMKITNEDEITQEYRRSLQDSDWFPSHQLKDLQDMYILCCKEIPRENEVNVCLQDVIIDRSCKQEEYRENLKQLTTRNKQNIRSVYINMFDMKYTPYNTAMKVIDYFSLSDLENEKMYCRDIHQWRDCLQMTDKGMQKERAKSLLNMNILPDQAEVHLALSVFEKSSETFISICSSISDYIRTKSSEIIEVWAAYKCDEFLANREYKLVFVAITKTGNAGVSDYNYEIVERGQDDFSGESEKVLTEVENGMPEEDIFSKSALSFLKKSVSENADILMNKHRNINVVSPSVKKSKNFGKKDAVVYDKLCIALYVHVKGLVPIEEEPFPSIIRGFPTDVLEDVFSLFCGGPNDYHEHLKMGLAIHANVPVSRDGVLRGTLGGFINYPSVGICALTCAHIVLSKEEMIQLKECKRIDLLERNKEVFQPVNCDSKAFGRLLSAFYSEGRDDSSSMEVVLVKIEDRFPRNGSFPAASNYADAGFDERNPMVYNTGKVCPIDQIPLWVQVYKYGISTGVTRGRLTYGGSVVRASSMNMPFDFRLYNQIEVVSLGSKTFAEHGDSGALVFFDDHGRNSVAIGIVEGGLKNGKVLVTPICEILRNIGAPPSMATFICNASISTNSGRSDDVHDDESEFMDTSS